MEKGQLIFNLGSIETYDPQDFYISKSNFNVSALLKSNKDWYNRSAAIYGANKSGKTHLLNIWSVYNKAHLINCIDVIHKNGTILCDDYNLGSAPGVKKAIDEYINLNKFNCEIICDGRFAKIQYK